MALSPRIFRVHGSDYYSDEAREAPWTHTDGALEAVARMGYDGVWIHAELRDLAPTALFRRYVPDHAERLEALRTTVLRARDHGLGLWLYLNEPRAYPRSHPFWKEHPECRGEEGADTAGAWRRGQEWLTTYAMCLSSEPVREFLQSATRDLFSALPELAGAFVITASEHHTHCWSHVARTRAGTIQCPRCRDRSPLEMPVEVARALQAGLDQSGSSARLAMWTWSWQAYGPDPQQPILDGLPAKVALLSDFERGESVTRLGKPMVIDEYSMAIAGPSRRFRAYREGIRASGRAMWAKLQVNATHELATVPNIPVPGLLYDKVAAARATGCTGALATWSIAVRPTLNSFAAGRLLSHEGGLPPRDEFLARLARDYFGDDLTVSAVRDLCQAWAHFDRAMENYPSTMLFIYFSPVNYAPAYPWKWKRTGQKMARSWTNDPWGDNLEMTTEPFTLGEIAHLLALVAAEWHQGILCYRATLDPLAGTRLVAWQELDVAEACGLFFQSASHCYAFADAVARDAPAPECVAWIDRELALCERLLPILERDPRIGWHDETRSRMVDAAKVLTKIDQLRRLREHPDA